MLSINKKTKNTKKTKISINKKNNKTKKYQRGGKIPANLKILIQQFNSIDEKKRDLNIELLLNNLYYLNENKEYIHRIYDNDDVSNMISEFQKNITKFIENNKSKNTVPIYQNLMEPPQINHEPIYVEVNSTSTNSDANEPLPATPPPLPPRQRMRGMMGP
jgi:hypothetical protein